MNDRRRNTVRIDYDRLAEAIVKAELKVNDELEQREETEYEKIKEEWNGTLGINDELKGIKKLDNNIKGVLNILFIKKEKVITLSANNALLKLTIMGIYALFEFVLYAFIAVGLGTLILFLIKGFFSWGLIVIAITILLLFIARIIRIARFEVEKISDQNYLATLFSAVIAFVAIIISIVAIVISIIYKG